MRRLRRRDQGVLRFTKPGLARAATDKGRSYWRTTGPHCGPSSNFFRRGPANILRNAPSSKRQHALFRREQLRSPQRWWRAHRTGLFVRLVPIRHLGQKDNNSQHREKAIVCDGQRTMALITVMARLRVAVPQELPGRANAPAVPSLVQYADDFSLPHKVGLGSYTHNVETSGIGQLTGNFLGGVKLQSIESGVRYYPARDSTGPDSRPALLVFVYEVQRHDTRI